MAQMRSLPAPFGGRQEEEVPVSPTKPEEGETPVKLVSFDNPYEGPTQRELPGVPKPLTPLSPRIEQPEITKLPEGVQGSLEFIAKAMAQILQQPRSFVTGNLQCVVANRGYQLPSYEIPLFTAVVVQAWWTNVGIIYVAYRQSDAQNAAVGFPLAANAGVSYRIQNTNGIWIMATTVNEGASFTVEQA